MAIGTNLDIQHRKTKHYSVRCEWLKEKVKLGLINFKYISTTEQIADILTKAMSGEQFAKLRNRMLGIWNHYDANSTRNTDEQLDEYQKKRMRR